MTENDTLNQERWALLREMSSLLEKPLVALSFIWLVLMILDFSEGLGVHLEVVANLIWVVFILDFLIALWIAPRRLEYLRTNWLTALSITLPAFRLLQLFRFAEAFQLARFGRSVTAARLVTSVRRSLKALNKTLDKRKFGYVLALTVLVVFAGAAGMLQFESGEAEGFRQYGDSLWWTAALMVSMGLEYWPKTVEGRILSWFLSLYALTVFGYITATLATHFIQSDKKENAAS